MKKISIILLLLMIALTLTACGGTEMQDQGLDVETKQIATMDPEYSDDIPWQYKQILDLMSESDAGIEKFDAAEVSKDLTKELKKPYTTTIMTIS